MNGIAADEPAMPDEAGAVGRDHAQCHLRRHDRRAQAVRQRAHAMLAAAGHDPSAGDDERPAGLSQQVGGGGNGLRRRPRTLGDAIALRREIEFVVGEFAFRGQHILRKIEVNRSRASAERLAEGAAHQLGHAARVMHDRIPLGQRLEYGERIQIHEHSAVRISGGAMLVGRDQQHGEIVVAGDAGAGGEVEPARSHFAQRHRHPSGAGIGCRSHHRAGGLVTDADIADARLARDGVQQRSQLAADDAEHERDLLGCQHPQQRLRARQFHAAKFPSTACARVSVFFASFNRWR